MKCIIFALIVLSASCSSPTAPTPTGSASAHADLVTAVNVGDPDTGSQGAKSCVLTPADPTTVPVCNYTCPNGTTFSIVNTGYPETSCRLVNGYPKK